MGSPFVKREPFEADKRKAMTPARRRRILNRFDGCCSYPECEETEGLEIDHTIALALGGKDEDANLAPLCRAHHRQKTIRDQKFIAKAKRIVRKNAPETRKPPRLKSRGFDRTIRRKMNGTIERKT